MVVTIIEKVNLSGVTSLDSDRNQLIYLYDLCRHAFSQVDKKDPA